MSRRIYLGLITDRPGKVTDKAREAKEGTKCEWWDEVNGKTGKRDQTRAKRNKYE